MRRAALLLLLALALGGCTVNVGQPTSSSPTTATTKAPPTTAAATSTSTEAAYLADLASGLGFNQDEEYVTSNPDRMVRVGYEMCQDYRRGVSASDEMDSIRKQLLADPTYQPQLGDLRSPTAGLAVIDMDLAVREYLCPGVA